MKFDENYIDSQDVDPCKYHCVAITGITQPDWLGFQEEKYEIKNYGGKDEKHKYIPVNMPFLEVIWKEFDKISFSFKSISSKLKIVPGSCQGIYIQGIYIQASVFLRKILFISMSIRNYP